MFEFKFPDVGEGVHEGKILQLKFKKGDNVHEGDILAVIETDKVVVEVPSPKSGTLNKYGAEEGQVINVGDVLAYIEIEGTDAISHDKEEVTEEPEEETAGVVGELELAKGAVLPASGEGLHDRSTEAIGLVPSRIKVLATPAARKVASDMNVDINKVIGTGPAGRVMKEDIIATARKLKPESKIERDMSEAKLSQELTKTVPPISGQKGSSSAEIIELSTMRKTIAQNMEESQRIPVAVVQDFTVIDELVKFRKEINEKSNIHITYQPFLIKALSAVLKKFPQLNTTYNPNKKEISYYKDINIGFAVDTEVGLIVPVIKNVERKSIIEISENMNELVSQAKNRAISIDDIRGGTFSITNYGPFGGVYGRPMIMPPQTAIIGIGRIYKTPVVNEFDEIYPAMVLPVSLTFDHRVIDGALAGSFITYFLKLLNNPGTLLVSM